MTSDKRRERARLRRIRSAWRNNEQVTREEFELLQQHAPGYIEQVAAFLRGTTR